MKKRNFSILLSARHFRSKSKTSACRQKWTWGQIRKVKVTKNKFHDENRDLFIEARLNKTHLASETYQNLSAHEVLRLITQVHLKSITENPSLRLIKFNIEFEDEGDPKKPKKLRKWRRNG